jgi:hypothetical protein
MQAPGLRHCGCLLRDEGAAGMEFEAGSEAAEDGQREQAQAHVSSGQVFITSYFACIYSRK